MEIYYQCNVQETHTNMLLELFCQIIHEPCFDILRTQEQLGECACVRVWVGYACRWVRVGCACWCVWRVRAGGCMCWDACVFGVCVYVCRGRRVGVGASLCGLCVRVCGVCVQVGACVAMCVCVFAVCM